MTAGEFARKWIDPETGYACEIVHRAMEAGAFPNGWYCVYVTVPPTHPAYGKSYSNLGSELDIPFELTFDGIDGEALATGHSFGWDHAHFWDEDHPPTAASMALEAKQMCGQLALMELQAKEK